MTTQNREIYDITNRLLYINLSLHYVGVKGACLYLTYVTWCRHDFTGYFWSVRVQQ